MKNYNNYIISFILLFFFVNNSYSQHGIGFEVNSGVEGGQSYPSGLIEVGDKLITIDITYANNFNQSELKMYDKSEGDLLFSEILSNSFDDYYSITQAVEIDESSDYIFIINKSGFDSTTGQQTNSSLVYNYSSDGLILKNTLSNIKTSLIVNYLGDIFLIDSSNLNIHKLNTTDYSVLVTDPILFANNDFTSSSVFKLEGDMFLFRGNVNSGSNNNDVFLSKFDLTAEVFWENVIQGSRNDYINAATSINDEIYLCGKSLSYDGIFADQYGDGIEWGDEPFKTNWVMKLSADGDVIWNKLFNPSWYQQQNGQFLDIYNGDSYIIVSGSSYNTYDYYSSYDSHYNQDVLSVKLDLDGNMIWENTYGGFNNQVFRSFGVSNNQIIYTTYLNRWYFAGGATGFPSQGQVTAEENEKFNYFSSTNQNDIWVFATDFEGEIQWNQFYGGEKNEDISYSVYNSDAVYCFGSTSSDGFDVGELTGNTDSWLFKLEVNESPIAVDDNYSLPEDSELVIINVIENDTDIENDVLSITSINYSGSGTVGINSNNLSINYTPESDFNGVEEIEYTVYDGNSTDIGVLTLNVTPVNDAPVSFDDIIELNEGDSVSVLQNGETSLLHNDYDIENDQLYVSLVEPPLFGALELNPDGTFIYQHDGSENDIDYFSYKVDDGDLDSNVSHVSIFINPVNQNAPYLLGIIGDEVNENSSNIQVGYFDIDDLDMPNDSHIYELVEGEGDDDNSNFSINGNNLYLTTSLDYESQPYQSIRVKVTDENNHSDEGIITIYVIDVNDINITSEVSDSYCSDSSGTGSITITSINEVTGEVTFNWLSENGGIVPSGQENNQNLSNLVSGTYILNLFNNNFSYTQQFEIGISPPYGDLTICKITSDDVYSTNNRIYLNNSGNYNIDYYEILRETSVFNEFESIGQIPSSEISFLDQSSNNTTQSYSYKVRSIDYCGETSLNSERHKTILLQSSVAVDNSVNLSWSNYEGASYESYNIYRNVNEEGFQLLTSLSFGNNSYTDSDADVTENTYLYYVSISVENCSTEGDRYSTDFSQIISNLQDINGSLSIDHNYMFSDIYVYPNPTRNIINIKKSNSLLFLKCEVYNSLGQQVLKTQKTRFSVNSLPSSTYFIKIYTDKGVAIRRFIKE